MAAQRNWEAKIVQISEWNGQSPKRLIVVSLSKHKHPDRFVVVKTILLKVLLRNKTEKIGKNILWIDS